LQIAGNDEVSVLLLINITIDLIRFYAA